MGKNKGNRGAGKYQSPGLFGNKSKEAKAAGPFPTPPVKEEPKLTVEDVAKSETQEAFEASKAKLISDLKEEADLYQKMAAEEKKDYENTKKKKEAADQELQQLKDEIDQQRETLSAISAEADTARRSKEEAESQAKQAIEKAEAEASRIVNKATVEATKKKSDAHADAQKEFEEVAKQIEEREKDLNKKTADLEASKRNFNNEKMLLDLAKIELDAAKEEMEAQKALFAKANPTRLDSLERKLEEKQEEYDQLSSDFREQRKKYVALQTKLDSIKAEVEDPETGRTEYAVKDLLDEIRELKDELAQKKALLEKYPSGEEILQLENRASSAEKAEADLVKALHERDEYRQRYDAERNLTGELTATKRELDATRALNEHLLQELEKNKTALENRTGNVCPSLTKVDEEASGTDFTEDIEARKGRKKIKTLDELIDVIYNFAGNGNANERLFYEKDDIRSFLAGMAVSKLIILKGMSGTGKSSMPRIVSKAISGNHSLIPVESSWRDRNELLGYYNDFNKLFNAKTFTIELYRSGKATEIPSFIVLDEMNLARIEYYFSDFLAILEEPDRSKWLVELVSSDMRTLPYELSDKVERELQKADRQDAYELWMRKKQLRAGNTKVAALSEEEENTLKTQLAKLNALIGAKDLIDGRKIKIPENVWFVGTANEDESTFEISDKVYDRSQVVVLNKKGKPDKTGYDPDIVAHFISFSALDKLFEKAINEYKEKEKVEKRLDEIDDILIEKFHVSFGNRIVSQATKFAAVFTAAGGDFDKALDFQISTKILRKIYNSDDVEAFKSLLNICGNYETTCESIQRKMERLG